MESMLLANWANMGAATCYEYTFIPINVTGFNQASYRGEYRLVGHGNYELVRWTPNALTFMVDSDSAAMLVINQNYNRSWRLSRGHGQVVNYRGLLAVKMPPGRQLLTLSYRSEQFFAGLAVAAVAILLAAGLTVLWRDTR
jgi:uncharacterized membrane protein YfhO